MSRIDYASFAKFLGDDLFHKNQLNHDIFVFGDSHQKIKKKKKKFFMECTSSTKLSQKTEVHKESVKIVWKNSFQPGPYRKLGKEFNTESFQTKKAR